MTPACSTGDLKTARLAHNSPHNPCKSEGRVQSFEASVFNTLLQTGERHVPLLRDEVEVAARVLKALLIQLPEALASAARTAHEAGVLHHAQMFGDGLPRDAGACGESAD